MDAHTTRLANLATLINLHGGQTALAKKIGAPPSYLSQIINRVLLPSGKERNVGDSFARKIEGALGKERGWMDRLHDEHREGGPAPARRRASTDVEECPHSQHPAGRTVARQGVSYEEVAHVAAGLLAKGREPTNRLVLAEVGGSATTVHRHLKAWRSANPREDSPPPSLPLSIVRAIHEEMDRQRELVRQSLATELSSARDDADDFARHAERAEAAAEDLRAQVLEQSGRLDEQRQERDRLLQVTERQQEMVGSTRVSIGKMQVKLEQLQATEATNLATIAALTKKAEASSATSIEAQQKLSTVTAAAAAATENAAALKKQNTYLTGELQARDLLIAEHREKIAGLDQQLASAKERAAAADQLVQDLRADEAAMREKLRIDGSAAGRLKARLAARRSRT